MTNQEVIELYKPLVPFLAGLLGPDTEVLLHDVSAPEQSVVAISNGYLSGRDIGSPLTDFAKDLIRTNTYSNEPFLSNYSGTCKGKDFLSSTFFIKNEGKIIGMLCINRDMSLIAEFENIVEILKSRFNLNTPTDEMVEHLDAGVGNQSLQEMIQEILSDYGTHPSRLKKEERIAIVKQLRDHGAFEFKGSVGQIAKHLHVSEPTLYRYLNNC